MIVPYQRKMSITIEQNMIVKLKRKTWYYATKDNNKRSKEGYPDGGFLDQGEKLLVCNVDFTYDGVIKTKVLHNKKNIIYLVFQPGNEDYFFEV